MLRTWIAVKIIALGFAVLGVRDQGRIGAAIRSCLNPFAN